MRGEGETDFFGTNIHYIQYFNSCRQGCVFSQKLFPPEFMQVCAELWKTNDFKGKIETFLREKYKRWSVEI